MKRETLHVHQKELRDVLLPRLLNRVFHVTGRPAFESILKDRALKPLQDLSFGYGVSNCFFRKRGCLSVCDLRALSAKQLDTALTKFFFLNPSHTDNRPAFFLLNPRIHEHLVPWTEWRKEEAWSDRVVPDLEAGYPREIRLSDVDEILELEIENPPDPLTLALLRGRAGMGTANVRPANPGTDCETR